MAGDLEMGAPRPSRTWRAEGHRRRREVTVSKEGPPCSQQGGCVLGFHMGLRKRGGLQTRGQWPTPLATQSPPEGLCSVPAARNSLQQAIVMFLILVMI